MNESAFQEKFAKLVSELRRITLFSSCKSVLGWDEQVNMPHQGAEHRANQLSLLAGMAHQMATSRELGDLIGELEAVQSFDDPEAPQAAVIGEARREFDRATKLPQALVEEMSKVTSLGHQAWVEARQKKEFSGFQPWLEKIVSLKREEAEAIGYEGGQPYDALLDGYEPGASTAEIDEVFTAFRGPLVELLQQITGSSQQPDISILERSYPVDRQKEFALEAATAIGFDFDAGRLDIAAHPFCSGFGPGDCRLTTRYDEHHFPGAFFGTLHEAGHGIYEQGLDPEWYGTAIGESASLGIHESQSRMWENLVGRSQPFWQHSYARAQELFPAALNDVSQADFHRAINDVRPSFIRVEADEVTYNLHIMLRFELEQLLIGGELSPGDVPAVWDEKFEASFGIKPPDVAKGCLQDVHWSMGLIGYFPTYSLGNMYASQIFNQAVKDLGNVEDLFSKGEFLPLKEWLNENIHRRGRRYKANRIVEVVTGESLSHEPLLEHLRNRFGPLYGL
jgi:carboxypeptidase Taq